MPNTLPEILYEDNHILIVNKRAGDIVQGDKTGDMPLPDLLKNYLKEKYQKPGQVFLGVVHRLDRPVSGAIIFARTSKALTRLTKMVKAREIHKTYWALVNQLPTANEQKLVHFLRKNEKQNKSYVVKKESSGAKEAVLEYRLTASSRTIHLLEIDLFTGRHHQIRAQLAAIGCPIRGDVKYGEKRPNADGSICLHARKLSFSHPVTGETLNIEAKLPETPPWQHFQPL
ncbi:MAG: RluA family pseudouridine synthase [Lentimicrobium sp.]|jgi:23S rRNA pseudouridine1911/1915/1917 synthase|nr:RluA family pseudouridine synthase [Lentimicrobium sp.]MDD2526910.1 RluA family pseudouridine synthase [Lentimicrobiaceae bacterium]HAH59157.1 RNA pseudouridine synthase [Bacteroidales bacterium]